MYHFFVRPEQIEGETIVITGPDVNHIRNVLRMKPGEEILISNGIDRDYLCRVETFHADAVTAGIIAEQDGTTELNARIVLFQGLPKGDKMELIIQKAVELGVHEIVPVETRRAVVRLDAKKAEAKVRRYNVIAESAAKQSGRMMIPRVTEVMGFRAALEYASRFDVRMLPYENAKGMAATKAAVEKVNPGSSAAIFIGPEGGFEESEVEMAQAAGWEVISLGRRILRTETAGLTTLSILMYYLELQNDLI